ncbi:MAG: hypothetical protein GXO15_05610 [Crenarchaeota archaeon]|nr:hypothetical protein [Thermoproteota archaeon]
MSLELETRRPLLSAVAAYMFDGTRLEGELAAARRVLEERLPGDALYQLRESARITFHRHVVPAAVEARADTVADSLPLFIMYVHNGVEAVEPYAERLGKLPGMVYGALRGILASRREPRGSPMSRAVGFLEELERRLVDGGCGVPEGELGPLYSLFFAVAVVSYIYASGMQVLRLALAPFYGLARSSLERLTGCHGG